MFPISKSELSFGEISEYWAPELRWSRDMVQALLEGAWWRGEISSDSGPTRLELLKTLFKRMRYCQFPTIVFVTPRRPPPEPIELPEGALLINLSPLVFVPSDDPDTWSEESCIRTFQELAEKPSLQHYPEWSPGFLARKLSRDKFFRLIAARGWRDPTFWKQANDDDTTSFDLKPASEPMIEGALRRVYESAKKEGEKAPNIKEVAKPVQDLLRRQGYKASAKQIERIADRPEFKRCRRLPGKTLRSEKSVSRK